MKYFWQQRGKTPRRCHKYYIINVQDKIAFCQLQNYWLNWVLSWKYTWTVFNPLAFCLIPKFPMACWVLAHVRVQQPFLGLPAGLKKALDMSVLAWKQSWRPLSMVIEEWRREELKATEIPCILKNKITIYHICWRWRLYFQNCWRQTIWRSLSEIWRKRRTHRVQGDPQFYFLLNEKSVCTCAYNYCMTYFMTRLFWWYICFLPHVDVLLLLTPDWTARQYLTWWDQNEDYHTSKMKRRKHSSNFKLPHIFRFQ